LRKRAGRRTRDYGRRSSGSERKPPRTDARRRERIGDRLDPPGTGADQRLGDELRDPGPRSGPRRQYIAADGKLVPAGTQGAFPAAGTPFKAQDVKNALNGGTLPGTSYEQSRAYTNYIRRLQSGTSGFTCFASLQMPRG
jgi:hypothetical protein